MTKQEKAYKKAWYESNKERQRELNKTYRETHKDQIRATRKAYHEKHKNDESYTGRRKLAYKRWYEAHKEERAVYMKEYHQTHLDEKRAADKKYREKHRKYKIEKKTPSKNKKARSLQPKIVVTKKMDQKKPSTCVCERNVSVNAANAAIEKRERNLKIWEQICGRG